MIIAADIGNTRVKLGLFDEQGQLLDVIAAGHQELAQALHLHPRWAQIQAETKYLGLSTVGKEEMAQNLLQSLPWLPTTRVLPITHRSRLPIVNAYASPETLGMDRLSVAVGAWAASGQGPVLAIDAGTALKFDHVDAGGRYLGGAISPGLRMRFKALHTFTARLPLLEPTDTTPLIGQDTASSIRSGVMNGLIAEVEGTIARYQAVAGPSLQVHITGGDMPFLRNHLKSHNFADANLLLRGIHLLIRHNVQGH